MSDVNPPDIPALARDNDPPVLFAEENENVDDGEDDGTPVVESPRGQGLMEMDTALQADGVPDNDIDSPVRRPSVVLPTQRNIEDSPASSMSASSVESLQSF